MTSKEIVKAIMQEKGKKNVEFAFELKISPNALWDRLNNTKATKDLSVSTLDDMLRRLGYKILIVPRTTEVPDDGYTIE